MEHTVQRRIHPTHVNEQAHHGHMLCTFTITKQLIPQNLTCLAASSHGINVEVCECLLILAIAYRLVAVREYFIVVVENGLEEIVLDVSSP